MGLSKLTFGLINDTNKQALNSKEIEKNDLIKYGIENIDIINVEFPDDQYFKEETPKKQIVLHHTVSGVGVEGDIAYWRKTVERIGTSIIIGRDGKIYQCFSTKYWAHHLGTKLPNNLILNKQSIGVELDSWGVLAKDGNNYYPAIWENGKYVPNKNVKPLDINNVRILNKSFRGALYFEKYTDLQIESLRKLLIYWNKVYSIPLNYNEDMWDYSEKAVSGTPGIWTHVSYRKDKTDCYPEENLIKMLKSLKN